LAVILPCLTLQRQQQSPAQLLPQQINLLVLFHLVVQEELVVQMLEQHDLDNLHHQQLVEDNLLYHLADALKNPQRTNT
jgi:hypothetical protein